MKPANATFAELGTTVFEVMSKLAVDHEAINLGQGFPDTDGPEDVRRVAADAAIRGPNQYPRMMGIDELRQAVAAHEKRFYGLDIDWQSEVLVTSGATEALADCLLGLIEPGDEVVLIEPLYDSYLPIVRRAGGIPRLVRVTPPDWKLDAKALADAFCENTKLVLLNNPLNPAAKVFSSEELQLIADLAIRHDAYAVCDEVYEHLVFDGRPHQPLMTFPGMRERCLKIGSAGKTFSLTGWKVGYITAAAQLLAPVAKTHQFITFTTPPNLQRAVAFGLAKDDAYYRGLAAGMEAKRDRLAGGLAALGFKVMHSAGTYFITVDVRPLGLGNDDVEVCRKLTTEAGVAAIPVSAFYAADAPRHFLRFCFCKSDEVLDEALRRLSAFLHG
ncbi:MAG TPA: aminotransferase [Hyphomicrobiales bacterium]|nr:aminotransferase [Rhodobiaceae bacterium]HXK53610.1 aminotransferase [Hyphomicrobiales bacterium]